MNEKKISDETVINFYTKEPISMERCAKHFNLCSVTISRTLKRNDIHIWSRQELKQKDLNVNFFKEIDTEEKAYFLGLIFADGCVFKNSDKNNSLLVSIQLQKQDGYLIEKFKEVTKAPRKIVIDKRDGSKSITIVNNVFVNNLINHGVKIHKENRVFIPINSSLQHHFIRGLFDGDGSFYRTNHFNLMLCGYSYFHDIYNFIIKTLNMNSVKVSFTDNTYNCRWGSQKDVMNFANYIYKDATIYLERKFNEFKKYNLIHANTEVNTESNTSVSP